MKPEHHAAPGPRSQDERPEPCLQISIHWGTSVLHVASLDPPRSFHVGEESADFHLASPALGGGRVPVVLVDAARAVALVLPAGAAGWIELPGGATRPIDALVESGEAEECAVLPGARQIAFPLGSRARVELGDLAFCVALSHAGHAVAGHYHFDKKSLPFLAGSAVVQLGVLAALAFFMPSMGDPSDEGPSAEQIQEITLRLATLSEREYAEKEAQAREQAERDSGEGGTGTRAKGEQGSMGSPDQAATGHRFGIAGPAARDAHVARAAAIRDASEFGMVGLLSSGSGGDPNAPSAPWGRDDSLGNDPLSARGFGSAGLGLSGVGEGGGGLGRVGTIGHGGGTRLSAPGIGAGSGRSSALASKPIPAPQPAPAPLPEIAIAPPVREAAIDPNGRFVTTYRPGGGHLSAFESAVARGILPASTREVVSDVGARYAPVVAVPAGKALGLRADLERAKVAPGGGPFHMRVALQSTGIAPAARPHLSVHLVLDVSGSMAGESISHARDAAAALVDKLAPTDDFSLTTFSTSAAVRVPDGVIGSRRGEIKAVIQNIGAEGGTNIGEGLARGYEQASLPGIPADAVKVVLLLSDGRANEGMTGRESLSRLALAAFQRGIQTSSFGLGSDYDGALMSSIANDGAGGYYYLRSPDQIGPALATELDKRLDPVATAVEVRVRLKPGVDLLRVYGSRRLNDAEAARVRVAEVAADAQAQKRDHIAMNRHDDNEGGMRFFIPAFARDDSHALLFKLAAPAGAGTRQLGLIELKYKDRVGKRNVVEELPLELGYADSDGASAATVDPSVSRTVQGFAAGEALSEAAARIAAGDRSGAIGLLSEREAILRHASETLREPLFLRDADRLARLRSEAGGNSGAGDPLVLAMLLETAGRTHLH